MLHSGPRLYFALIGEMLLRRTVTADQRDRLESLRGPKMLPPPDFPTNDVGRSLLISVFSPAKPRCSGVM